jgi:hypothetical protein
MEFLGAQMKVLAGLLYLLSLSSAFGGGWVSGGGGIIKDAKNPWFVQNTKVVNWCVLHDSKNFNRTRALLINAVRNSITTWKIAIEEAGEVSIPGVTPKIGTQKFVFDNTCLPSTDIRFQFGVITEEQKKSIGDPRDYLALSMRTSYDKSNLKGKGFVYLSADSGPLKFKGKHIVKNLWAAGDGLFLHLALTHELGHIFGVTHSRVTERNDLMSEGFLNFALSKGFYDLIAKGKVFLKNSLNYFDISKQSTMQTFCKPYQFSKELLAFFEIQTGKKCHHLLVSENKLLILTGDSEFDIDEKLKVTPMKNTTDGSSTRALLYLTKDQSLFKFDESLPYFPLVLSKDSVSYEGQFESSNGPQIFYLELRNNGTLLLRGLIDGKLRILNQGEYVGK